MVHHTSQWQELMSAKQLYTLNYLIHNLINNSKAVGSDTFHASDPKKWNRPPLSLQGRQVHVLYDA